MTQARLDRHPLNRSFAWLPRDGPFRCLEPEQARSWNERGFFVLEGAFDHETLQALEAEIDPIEAQVEAFLRTRPERKLFIARADAITFTIHLVTRSKQLREFCTGPLFRNVAYDLLGPDVRLYWDQAVYKKPHTREEFPWHQDNGYNFVEPQAYLTCWVALTDATQESGCPWVVPGLHRDGTLRHWMTEFGWCCLEDPAGALPCPLRAGSVLVLSSLAPHRTGPNRTHAVRKAYIVQFAPDGARWVRDGPDGRPQTIVPCNDPERQFPILVGGRPGA